MKTILNKLFVEGRLKLIEPSEEIGNSYAKKSESNLISSKILFENNKLEESVALTYYSMYNIVLSLLSRIGIKCENHLGVTILLKEIFELDSLSLINAKKERIDKQYYTGFKITQKEVEKGIFSAEEFNRKLKSFILELNNSKIKFYRGKFQNFLK